MPLRHISAPDTRIRVHVTLVLQPISYHYWILFLELQLPSHKLSHHNQGKILTLGLDSYHIPFRLVLSGGNVRKVWISSGWPSSLRNVLKRPQKYGDLYWPTCSARCNHIFRRAQQKFVNPLHVVTRKPMMEIRFCIFAPQEHIYSSLVTRPSKAQFDIALTKK